MEGIFMWLYTKSSNENYEEAEKMMSQTEFVSFRREVKNSERPLQVEPNNVSENVSRTAISTMSASDEEIYNQLNGSGWWTEFQI